MARWKDIGFYLVLSGLMYIVHGINREYRMYTLTVEGESWRRKIRIHRKLPRYVTVMYQICHNFPEYYTFACVLALY